MLRNKSRPYLFSNSLPPAVVGASLKVFDLLTSSSGLRDTLEENTTYFRKQMTAAGFNIAVRPNPAAPP